MSPSERRPTESVTLGALLGRRVVTSDGVSVGSMLDVRARAVGSDRGVRGPLDVAAAVVGPVRWGGRLGYDRADGLRGPWMIRTIVRRLHRHSRLVRWEDMDVTSVVGQHPAGAPVRLLIDHAAFLRLSQEEVG